MKHQRNRRRSVASVVSLVVIAVLAWVFVAPLALGGRNSYLVTSGISMLPGIERGDLVVTRRTAEYRVGDVVAYREPRIGAVLHRIIDIQEEEGGRFVLQGDNNDFIDPYRPAESEIMGRLWLHVPGVGSWLTKAREPRNAALLAVAGGMVLSVPVGSRQVRQSRRHHGYGSGGGQGFSQPPQPKRGLTLGPAGQVLGMIVGVVALVSIALAGWAFSSPTERNATLPVNYEQRGEFSYTAEMQGTVYPNGKATTGEPVYRQLTDEIAVGFDYQLVSDAAAAVSGTYRIDAVISQDDGWSRLLPVVDETRFEGTAANIRGVLDLDAIQSEIDSARKQTGLDSQPLRSYAVTLVPTIALEGLLGTATFQETFAPELRFTVEPLVVKVAAGSPGVEDATPFRTVATGAVSESRTVPNTIALPGYELTIADARGVAQIGLALTIVGGFALVVMVGLASNADEPARIRSRYGPLLITLRGSDLGDNVRLIEVGSIEDLVKVAEREGRMVLHQESGAIHQYFVQDIDVTYRYQSRPASNGRPRARAERAL